MATPPDRSSKISADLARPISRVVENSSQSPVASDAAKVGIRQPLASMSSPRPRRILVNATSRADALAQARQIAATLSRELQPIDLQQVVSKYIRETEKKLLALVDTAEETGAILFFDEAEALFGKRSEVKDAHDRYANLETSYFRERIETYPGTVIIAATQPTRLDPVLLQQHTFSEFKKTAP